MMKIIPYLRSAAFAAGKIKKIVFFSLYFFAAALAVVTGKAESVIPVPAGQQSFPYSPVAVPQVNDDPALSRPVGVGSAASGGSTISLGVGLGQFSAPVDVYFGIYAPSIDPNETYLLTSDFNLTPVSGGLMPWIAGTLGNFSTELGNIPVTALPPGTYVFFLGVSPAGSLDAFYLWTTNVVLVAPDQTNVLPVTVNGSLCAAGSYPNKPCVAVTLCGRGTSDCQTINDIVLDTGSFGLRIFRQLLNIPLQEVRFPSGSLAECAQFGGGSSFWGPVQTADIILGGEPAVTIPIQVIDSTFAMPPLSCQNIISVPAQAGFNGILGVGVLAQDCGPVCSSTSANGIYYACNGKLCAGTAVPPSLQVQNPVPLLPQDNNGLLIQLPPIPDSGAGSVSGSLVLGIGTRSNNLPSGVTTFATDQFADFFTTFNGLTYRSFIDSGSNGFFFSAPRTLLPVCPAPFNGWFCTPAETSLSAINISASGSATGPVSFKVGNFELLISSGNRVFDNIGGPGQGEFDWGLPFFFGRNVFVGFEGTSSSLGSGPYYAY